MEHIKQFQIKDKAGNALKSAWYAYLSKTLKKNELSDVLLCNINTFIAAYKNNTITEEMFIHCILKNENDKLKSKHIGVLARICYELNIAPTFVDLVFNNSVLHKKDLTTNEFGPLFSSHVFSEIAIMSGALGYEVGTLKSAYNLTWNVDVAADDWISILHKINPEFIKKNNIFLQDIEYIDKGNIKEIILNTIKKNDLVNKDTIELYDLLAAYSIEHEIKYLKNIGTPNLSNSIFNSSNILKTILAAFDNKTETLSINQKVEFLANVLKTKKHITGSLSTFEQDLLPSYVKHINTLPTKVKEAYALALQLDSELPIVALLHDEQQTPDVCINYSIDL